MKWEQYYFRFVKVIVKWDESNTTLGYLLQIFDSKQQKLYIYW